MTYLSLHLVRVNRTLQFPVKIARKRVKCMVLLSRGITVQLFFGSGSEVQNVVYFRGKGLLTLFLCVNYMGWVFNLSLSLFLENGFLLSTPRENPITPTLTPEVCCDLSLREVPFRAAVRCRSRRHQPLPPLRLLGRCRSVDPGTLPPRQGREIGCLHRVIGVAVRARRGLQSAIRQCFRGSHWAAHSTWFRGKSIFVLFLLVGKSPIRQGESTFWT